MCNACLDHTVVHIPTTTIDITLSLEMSVTVPSIDFDPKTIEQQLGRDRYNWARGLKLDKNALAWALGMDTTKFVHVNGTNCIDLTRVTMIRYDKDGKEILRHEEPR